MKKHKQTTTEIETHHHWHIDMMLLVGNIIGTFGLCLLLE